MKENNIVSIETKKCCFDVDYEKVIIKSGLLNFKKLGYRFNYNLFFFYGELNSNFNTYELEKIDKITYKKSIYENLEQIGHSNNGNFIRDIETLICFLNNSNFNKILKSYFKCYYNCIYQQVEKDLMNIIKLNTMFSLNVYMKIYEQK